MKTNRVSRLLFALALASIFIATWSCNDDDGPSLQSLREDRLKFIEDSLRVSDSLRLTNNAGIVNYGVTIVDGSTSSFFANGRTDATKAALGGAIVTISQYGKVVKDTTDASGIAVFNGFFRSAVNITIEAPGFTKVSYIAAVNIQDSTRTGTISFVGNIIPVFAITGANTSTISGRATIQTDLTNRERELVPDGTRVTATIDATNDSDFSDKFLTTDIDEYKYTSGCGCEFIYVGNVLQATYETGAVGTVANGDYTITVPTAVDGLPLTLQYSDIAANQTLYQQDGDDQTLITNRVIFTGDDNATPAALPPSSGATVSFESFGSQAFADAVISSSTGAIERINVTDGGSGYVGTPLVQFTGGGGTGATATALVNNGRVTGFTITNAGTGYTTPPTVSIISGGNTGTASSTLDPTNFRVFSVAVTSQGSGYTSAPTITFTGASTGTTTQATATATIANGRLVAILVQTQGQGYTGTPTVDIAGGGGGTGATAVALMGQSVEQVNVLFAGTNHVYAPTVTFSAPDFSNGTRAQGVAIVDPATRTILGVQVTNTGTGYTAPPTVNFNGGAGASAQSFLAGGSIISFDVFNEGSDYAYAPTVVIGRTFSGNGSGATGTAVMSGGRVVGINIDNAGSGYTSAPSVELVSGEGAVAYANVNATGGITSYTIVRGGTGYTGAPRVVISSGSGNGATATATATAGEITAIAVNATGSGYESGNVPASAEAFTSVKGNTLEVKPNLTYINDIHYGTGTVRNPN
ncbi:hypothetical protein SanaruYs_37850 [Chryseotalea sanaruensis]|uniref:Carboxypeptidase regulatory-like domain-containing protein n=1 Tax=Chryseotalea sanaruensis TaxID=2482724 RepID=A0A401UFB4_9BACT|nr:hypothetical protein [Chryseotalea sanaruensis]GCC53540.1 hypothetical protein SanaruYs_37850 [Chryseotalea sanaruensis]